MFTGVEHFIRTWSHESKTSQNVMDALTDQSLSQAVANDHRTLGRMAWHIVQSIPEIMAGVGLECDGPAQNEPMPKSAKEMRDAYAKVSTQLLEQVQKNWTDKTLLETDNLDYGAFRY